jgi:hypothetical protein
MDNARVNQGDTTAMARRLARASVAGALVIGSLFTSRAALAAACVEVDQERDNLEASDRDASRTLFEQALIDAGQKVVGKGQECTETWRIYSVKLGSSVTATVNSPDDRRTMKLRSVEDLPNAYSQMIKSLLSHTPMTTEGENVDRTNVTSPQMSPNRVSADSLWYFRLGYGGVVGGGLTGGPGFGMGWRKELDRIALDLSFLNMVVTKDNDSYKNFSGSWIKLGALYYFDPYANYSFYAGGGISWGATMVIKDTNYYSGSGIHGELTAGYEMFRASNIRLLFQFDASLPTYSATSDFYTSTVLNGVTTDLRHKDSVYAPSFVFSLGIGFGKSNTLIVRQID